jgi:hypothetical protein
VWVGCAVGCTVGSEGYVLRVVGACRCHQLVVMASSGGIAIKIKRGYPVRWLGGAGLHCCCVCSWLVGWLVFKLVGRNLPALGTEPCRLAQPPNPFGVLVVMRLDNFVIVSLVC